MRAFKVDALRAGLLWRAPVGYLAALAGSQFPDRSVLFSGITIGKYAIGIVVYEGKT